MQTDELRALEPHPAASPSVRKGVMTAGAGGLSPLPTLGGLSTLGPTPNRLKHQLTIADPIVENEKKKWIQTQER